jgi:hypothetical protein
LQAISTAPLNGTGVSFSAPGSRLGMASRAEASNTILFIASGLAPFRDQLVNQEGTWFHMLADKTLCHVQLK